MTKSNFRPYIVEGVARDEMWIINNRELVESHAHDDMRANGFLPLLDVPSDLHWEFVPETGHFKYKLTIKGKYVGKRKAKLAKGVLSEGLIISEGGKTVQLVS